MSKKYTSHSNSLYNEKTDPSSSHSIIYKWLSNCQPGIQVLDIGAATGILGKKCSGFGFFLKGLEPVNEWAQEAKYFYNDFLCTSLEAAPDEFLENQDVIVCADVLEHMPTPEKALKRLVELQNPKAQFLISVPNVAHIWIRANIIIGKFDYADCGILDRTHIRFFTKSTFLEMLKLSGLRLIEIKYTPAPLGKINPFFQTNPIGRLIQKVLALFAKVMPGLFAYQFVARSELSHIEDKI